jgi:CspA family cold shock protein
VKWFSAAKGYGFIAPADGSKDLFVHHSAILMEGYRELQEGACVEFETRWTEKGPTAVQVSVKEKD